MTSYKECKYCIVNGDDFGASQGINRGIVEAHTCGILTSASLMINMPASMEAIRLADEHPTLSVGLHVNFTNEGSPVIDLEDPESAKSELARQYRLFVERVGKAPSHIDTHHNIHRQPQLRPLFVEFADMHGILLREHSPVRYYSGFYGQWDGESHPEHVSPSQLVTVLETEIRPGFTELACHPGYAADYDSTYSREREVELRSLCDHIVRQRIEELQIELINFFDAGKLLRISERTGSA
ncbi:MAG TPA: ChbG/HpnK family deacetylase [Gammaproteobacteria bacterium]|nr:ChbG/HpnK family deacetylase [Gammaproteobacteria bacterium]